MAAGATYEPIATTTLGSATTTVTFSSISGSYTDLVLVTNTIATSAADFYIRFNNDTTSTYSITVLSGTGTSAVSNRSSGTFMYLNYNGQIQTSMNSNSITNIMNYANSTTYKTVLDRFNVASGGTNLGTEAIVGLWRSTSAITRIDISSAGANFNTGSTFTLYGISAAQEGIMANTYTLIEAKTLGSAVSSVTFSSIPSTYTDLLMKISTRGSVSQASLGYYYDVTFNGTSANRSGKYLESTGSAVDSSTYTLWGVNSPSDFTADTFSNGELYIPNYSGAAYKSAQLDSVNENNATSSRAIFSAGLWSDTAAINSITLTMGGGNFVTNSTFYLYGIKNS